MAKTANAKHDEMIFFNQVKRVVRERSKAEGRYYICDSGHRQSVANARTIVFIKGAILN